MKYRITDILPNYLIVNGEPEFCHGLLFPHNIVFQGEEISLPFATSIMERIRANESLLDNIQVLSRFGNDEKDAILIFECKNIFTELHLDEKLKKGTIYNGIVLAKSFNNTVIGVNGHYGFIPGIIAAQVDEQIAVSVVVNSTNNMGFCQFAEAFSISPLSSEREIDSQSIEEFLNKEELSAIDEKNRTLIEWLLENVDGLTRRSINVLREELHISYSPTAQSDLHRFLSENSNYFTDNNFWVGCYRDFDTNNVKVIIYDNNNVVIEVCINASGMWVTEFSHDKNKSKAQYLLDMNQKALVLSGAKIHLHENSYIREDYIESGERIFAQYEIAKKMIPELKRTIKSLKEKAGVEYLTLKEFLSYQEEKEWEYNKKHSVLIGANESEIATTGRDGHSTGLRIKSDFNVTALFTMHDSDTCHVELCHGDKKIKAELTEDPSKHGYLIEFYNSHMSIEEWKNSGFEIRRRAGVRHLSLQQDSIDNFVYGNAKLDIFDRLNRGELLSPEPDISISFFDEKFNNVEEGNNQPLAIRKAINNNDIFLIQGPPGTGKTSVIVEIVKQLVLNKGERVLVCSQAHSAVKNIYDRLKSFDERIKIGNIDEDETMIPKDIKEHPEFLRNNGLLLKALTENPENIAELKEQELRRYEPDYSTNTKQAFMQRHEYVCEYYPLNKPESPMELIGIISDLRSGLVELGEDAIAFNNARHYQGLNVVMGTCIGIGMDWGLQRSGIRFDTVIIDEAGKANLSETTVPMQLGKKFILVGDQKQLPPYMNKEEISDFLEVSKRVNLKQEEVEDAISSSLFEDFLEDENFPKDSTVLLNYQYRMNPQIGDYVSELFYHNELKNGRGTEGQQCNLDGFPSAVTFIDTSTLEYVDGRNIAHEHGDPVTGWYNPHEIEIFKNRLLPRLEKLKASDSEITVGVITPYRKQRSYLLESLRSTSMEGNVFTIDAIQGSEFDVVVLSLVRSFNPKKGDRKVGFLDDMRRLNVALSRAKKRLIIIGNLHTLCAESAHFTGESNIDIKPVEVFRKLWEIQERTAEKTSLEIIKDKIKSGEIAVGQIFEDCFWKFEDKNRPIIELKIDGSSHFFPIKQDNLFNMYGIKEKAIDVKLIGIGGDGRAKFEYLPNVTIAQQVSDRMLWSVMAQPIDWTDDKKDEMIFRFTDGSKLTLPVFYNKISPQGILIYLLESKYVKEIPLFVFEGHTASLNRGPYKDFAFTHKVNENIEVEVIDDYVGLGFYIVKCDNIFGTVIKRKGVMLRKGQVTHATIYKIFDNSVIFYI